MATGGLKKRWWKIMQLNQKKVSGQARSAWRENDRKMMVFYKLPCWMQKCALNNGPQS